MKSEWPTPLAILLAGVLVAAAIHFRPAASGEASSTQALYGNGYVYIVDLEKGAIKNMIPVKQ
jgi:hypothetical protein